MLTVDGREIRGFGDAPVYGSAVSALLEGIVELGEQVNVVSFAPIQKQVCLVEGAAVRHWSLPIPRHKGARWGYAGRIAAVRSWLSENPVDLVHAQGTECWCGWVAGWCGRPYVLTIHGHVGSLRRELAMRPRAYWCLHGLLEKRVIARAETVICLSRSVEGAVARLARSTCRIPNAVSDDFFASENHPEGRILLQIGDIVPGKRPLEMLRALDGLPKDFQMVFLGYVPPHSRYAKDFLDAVSRRPWSRIVPAGPRATVVGWLQRASVLVHPSLAENCPMAVLEAMAAGVPVVASAVGGIPDLISDEREGCLVPKTSVESLAARAHELLDSPQRAQHLAAAARARAIRFHRPEVVAGQTMRSYQDIPAGRDRPQPDGI